MNSSKNNKNGGYWNQNAPCTEEEVGRLMIENIIELLQKKDSDVAPVRKEQEDNVQALMQSESSQAPVSSPPSPSPPAQQQQQQQAASPPAQAQRQQQASPPAQRQQQPASVPAPEAPIVSDQQRARQPAQSAPVVSVLTPQQEQQLSKIIDTFKGILGQLPALDRLEKIIKSTDLQQIELVDLQDRFQVLQQQFIKSLPQ
jgi:hypothetical protein